MFSPLSLLTVRRLPLALLQSKQIFQKCIQNSFKPLIFNRRFATEDKPQTEDLAPKVVFPKTVLPVPVVSDEKFIAKPKDFKLPVFNLNGTTVGEVILKWEIFSQPIRKDILHRVVVWQQAKSRRGTHSQKTRAEKRGSNMKLRPQKGQGKARVGTNRAPHRRGGGRAFPKKPRSYFYPLPQAVRLLGLKIALSAKLAQGKIFIIDDLSLQSHKSTAFKEILDKTGWKSALLVEGQQVNRNLQLAAQRFFYSIQILPTRGLNVYSILHKDVLVLSRSSIDLINKRLISPPRFKVYDNSKFLSSQKQNS